MVEVTSCCEAQQPLMPLRRSRFGVMLAATMHQHWLMPTDFFAHLSTGCSCISCAALTPCLRTKVISGALGDHLAIVVILLANYMRSGVRTRARCADYMKNCSTGRYCRPLHALMLVRQGLPQKPLSSACAPWAIKTRPGHFDILRH